ncbi:MAG TPA: LamG-like jellyroll fold domain-containing protein, partial [Candidatus Eisenbacteria bacterium]
PGPTIPGNSWTFVAVSVDRVAATGTWYLNGAPVPGFDFSPPSGSLFNNADLLVGGRPGAPSWNGLIDELQFFGTPLSAQSIAAVAAAPAGKCREHCRVPAVTSICKDKPTVTICMNIVNQTNAPQSYHWSVAGLPSGPGCSVAGPVTFSPSSGTIVVPAGGISSPICITMTRPAGLINQNDTACFEFSFVNDATGVCRACVGKIRADNTCWCVTPAQPGVVAVGQRFAPGITGQPIVIGIKHPCDPVAVIDYRVTAVYEPGAHPDPLAVSLNGLPPGEPVLGSLSLDTEGETEVTVMATYPRAYDPAGLYQVVMEADTDGDGIMEVVSSTPIASTYEADAVSTVPDVAAPPVPLVSLKALPNPFQAKATLSVTLPVAGPVDLAVYDLSGRLIRRVFAGSVAAGPSTFLWDGRDEAGRETGGGIYFVRLVSGGVRQQAKLVRVR